MEYCLHNRFVNTDWTRYKFRNILKNEDYLNNWFEKSLEIVVLNCNWLGLLQIIPSTFNKFLKLFNYNYFPLDIIFKIRFAASIFSSKTRCLKWRRCIIGCHWGYAPSLPTVLSDLKFCVCRTPHCSLSYMSPYISSSFIRYVFSSFYLEQNGTPNVFCFS